VNFAQVNVVVSDMDAAVAFYQLLGVNLDATGGVWPPGTECRHAHDVDRSFDLDNKPMAHLWGHDDLGPDDVVIGFNAPTPDAVDETYRRLTEAGYRGRREPYDAFFGARYAIVDDPDGHPVGLMGPVDPARRYIPAQ
jgi:predicted lactoylglutathione lyase